ncbi:MED6-domain-containing protein, partial [Backusella circina FSU 941]
MSRLGVTEDLTSVEWRDTNWLERVGGFHNRQIVLDYFALSPFWDRQCNNQVLAMQTQYNDLRQPYDETVEALRKMTGIEFAIVHEQPPVWIIQKRYRRGPAPDDVNPIATYYIMGANVYQSPTIYSVIANRLLTSLFHVNSAFKETKKMMDFHPAKGYSWKTQNELTNSQKKAIDTPRLRAQETQAFRHYMDRAIETSAIKVAQTRQSIENPEAETGKLSVSQDTNIRDDANGKRQRKRATEEGPRKKKANNK